MTSTGSVVCTLHRKLASLHSRAIFRPRLGRPKLKVNQSAFLSQLERMRSCQALHLAGRAARAAHEAPAS